MWSCNKKHRARVKTIYSTYRSLFGKSLPENKQYWSMCGLCANEDGPMHGCELEHTLVSGIINPHQFHGVEIDEDRYNSNKLCPIGNWYHGDFYETMLHAHSKKVFDPAIVNIDTMQMPKKAAAYVGDILSLLSVCSGKILVIANVVLKSRYYKSSGEFAVQELEKYAQYAWNVADWKFHNYYYEYPGTGRYSKTIMASFIFIKQT